MLPQYFSRDHTLTATDSRGRESLYPTIPPEANSLGDNLDSSVKVPGAFLECRTGKSFDHGKRDYSRVECRPEIDEPMNTCEEDVVADETFASHDHQNHAWHGDKVRIVQVEAQRPIVSEISNWPGTSKEFASKARNYLKRIQQQRQQLTRQNRMLDDQAVAISSHAEHHENLLKEIQIREERSEQAALTYESALQSKDAEIEALRKQMELAMHLPQLALSEKPHIAASDLSTEPDDVDEHQFADQILPAMEEIQPTPPLVNDPSHMTLSPQLAPVLARESQSPSHGRDILGPVAAQRPSPFLRSRHTSSDFQQPQVHPPSLPPRIRVRSVLPASRSRILDKSNRRTEIRTHAESTRSAVRITGPRAIIVRPSTHQQSPSKPDPPTSNLSGLSEDLKYHIDKYLEDRLSRSSPMRRATKANITISGEQNTKKNGIIRDLFKDTYDVTKDNDFKWYSGAEFEDVQGFLSGLHGGPDADKPCIDMRSDIDSPWNQRVIDALVNKIQSGAEAADMGLPAIVWKEAIKDKLRRVKGKWKDAQPIQDPETGQVETPEEVEERLLEGEMEYRRRHRKDTRRDTKYRGRVRIVQKHIDLRKATGDRRGDLSHWDWLYKMLTTYGEQGMSSDESIIDNNMPAYRVTVLAWRRDIEYYLDYIDSRRLDGVAYTNRGAKPGIRRHDRYIQSERKPVLGLPRSFYNEAWLDIDGEGQAKVVLSVAEEEFRWLETLN